MSNELPNTRATRTGKPEQSRRRHRFCSNTRPTLRSGLTLTATGEFRLKRCSNGRDYSDIPDVAECLSSGFEISYPALPIDDQQEEQAKRKANHTGAYQHYGCDERELGQLSPHTAREPATELRKPLWVGT